MPRSSQPTADYWIGVYEADSRRTREPARQVIRAVYDLMHSTEKGAAVFTVRDVAAQAGVGVSTAWRVIERLEQLGVLSQRGSRYRHHWPPQPPSGNHVSERS